MDIQFGGYRLKRDERLLLGPEGIVELSARSFEILAKLLSRPDEVVSKSELFDTVRCGRKPMKPEDFIGWFRHANMLRRPEDWDHVYDGFPKAELVGVTQ
jgi:hypothetical protein